MRTPQIYKSFAMLLALCFVVGLALRNNSVTSAYPPPPTPTPRPNPPNLFRKIYLPLTLKFPPAAPSYYVTNLSTLYNLGVQLGNKDRDAPGTQDNLVILDFGYPASQTSGDMTTYGTYLVFAPTTFVPLSSIFTAGVDFARGYWLGTGADLLSHVRIVVGTNNCCTNDPLTLFQQHGTAWAQSTDSIRSYIASSAYRNQVDVVAGSDMQQQIPGGNDPYATTQWVDNYKNASTCTPGSGVEGCLYNFGNLVISISGTTCATSRGSAWTACDVWYISWGASPNAAIVEKDALRATTHPQKAFSYFLMRFVAILVSAKVSVGPQISVHNRSASL